MSEFAISMWILGIWGGMDLLVILGFGTHLLYKAELYRRRYYPDRPVTRELLRTCRKDCRWLNNIFFDEMGIALSCTFAPLAVAAALVAGTVYGLFWASREFMYFMLIRVLGGDNAAIRKG